MSVGGQFCLLGTQLTKNRLGRHLAPPGSFRDFFWLIGTAVVVRNFLDVTMLDGCRRVFREICDLVDFGNLGDAKKWNFPVLEAVLGKTPANQIWTH